MRKTAQQVLQTNQAKNPFAGNSSTSPPNQSSKESIYWKHLNTCSKPIKKIVHVLETVQQALKQLNTSSKPIKQRVDLLETPQHVLQTNQENSPCAGNSSASPANYTNNQSICWKQLNKCSKPIKKMVHVLETAKQVLHTSQEYSPCAGISSTSPPN